MLAFRIISGLALLAAVTAADNPVGGFKPRSYTKQTAECPAIHRHGGNGAAQTETSITMSYVDLNPPTNIDTISSNRTLLLVHGWGGIWSGWSNQIMHFKDKYRLIVPDLRGFGDSSHPGDVQASGTHGDIVGDLICILDKTGVDKAVCVGHDWGSHICFEAARMRPDRFEAVVGSVLPYLPAAGPSALDISALTKALPKLTYTIYFQKSTSTAIAELNADIRRSLRALLRSVASPPPNAFLRSRTSFLKGYREMETIPPSPFLSEEEEDYYVEQYSKQGFGNTLQFYTQQNRHLSWEFSHSQGNLTIPKPVLAIYPIRDPVADWPLVAVMAGAPKFLPYLTKRVIETAHWPHMERPREFNAMLEKWLDDLDIKLMEVKLGEMKEDIKGEMKGEIENLKLEIKEAKRGRKEEL